MGQHAIGQLAPMCRLVIMRCCLSSHDNSAKCKVGAEALTYAGALPHARTACALPPTLQR